MYDKSIEKALPDGAPFFVWEVWSGARKRPFCLG
jgi:hypothetical protein